MSFLYSLLYSKLHPPRNPTSSFAGQTVLVTGANCGLGFEAALKFVSLGASTVILTCRTPSKGQEAKQQIEERTGRKDVCRVMQVEMGSFESIRAFTEQVKEVGNLDIALLNAGVVQPDYRLSNEGWEETLQVNVLGTTMLGSILLHMMRQSKAPPSASGMKHLCFVSSGNYASASLSPQALASPNLLEYFNERDHFGGPEPQYNISKLFLMYAANELAASVDTGSEKDDEKEESVVIVNSVNPGATATNLTRNITGVVLRIVAYIYLCLLARTAEEGSRSLVSACAQGEESHGQLWQDDRIEGRNHLVDSAEGHKLQKRIWREIGSAVRGESKDIDLPVAE